MFPEIEGLTPKARAAIDLARRCVPAGEQISGPLLIAAACRVAGLEDELPDVVAVLPATRA